MTTRDIYPKHVKVGMIIRWHPSQFPANRPPDWRRVVEVDAHPTDRSQVWIGWDNSSGRWFFDSTPLQERTAS